MGRDLFCDVRVEGVVIFCGVAEYSSLIKEKAGFYVSCRHRLISVMTLFKSTGKYLVFVKVFIVKMRIKNFCHFPSVPC
jgi:hypothetical protein